MQRNISKAQEDWKNKNAEFNIYLEEWKSKIDEKLEEKDNAIAKLEDKLETKTKDFDNAVELKSKQIALLEIEINKLRTNTLRTNTNANFENRIRNKRKIWYF